MNDGVDKTKRALEIMKSVQTVDDMKAHEEEVLSMIEKAFGLFTDAFRTALEASPDNIMEGMADIEELQGEKDDLQAQLDAEMERVAKLPGADEYMEQLRSDMEMRLMPHLEELAELMGRMMGGIMEGMVGGFGEMMDNAFGPGEGFEPDEDEKKEPKDEE